jgi:hypothetical protein
MANSFKGFFKPAALLCLILGLSGCTALGLTVPAVAVSGGAAGVSYTLTNNAYKTISYPLADVETALNEAFKKMDIDIKETKTEKGENKVSISAVAGDLDIGVELEKITPTVTKIEVSAKKDIVIKDKSTATEIIVQTEKNLEEKK